MCGRLCCIQSESRGYRHPSANKWSTSCGEEWQIDIQYGSDITTGILEGDTDIQSDRERQRQRQTDKAEREGRTDRQTDRQTDR